MDIEDTTTGPDDHEPVPQESPRRQQSQGPPTLAPLSPSKESSICVSVRVRPFTSNEENNLIKVDHEHIFLGDGSLSEKEQSGSNFMPQGIRKIIDVVDDKMLIFDPPETNPIARMHRNVFPSKPHSRIREHRFVFDQLFDTHASQTEVFSTTTKPLLDSILDGFNATVFAYGATGCGKTHTISGTPDDPGIIFLTMKELYCRMDEMSESKVFDVSFSFLEIYNETIKDLLDPNTNQKKLVIREDTNNKVFVANLSSHKPQSVEEVMDLILKGNKNRTCSPTEANATSSRSHAVLQINVIQRNKSMELSQEHVFATLSIIDLAGSERASATKNRGIRLNEGANINKSLLALGNCINALCDPRKRNHIPYRDSKLTRLLKFSLGGNCKTVMIVCVSPSSQHYDETLNTLKYADRAKMIKTKLIRNQHNLDRHVGSYLKMITQQKTEIEELKHKQANVADATIEKQQKISALIFESIFDNISTLRSSVFNKSQDRWQKYFILAKRKVLLNQKMDFETLQAYFDSSSSNPQVQNLVEQVLSKLSLQIQQLELQYHRQNDVEVVLEETAHHVLTRLKEQEYWSEHHTQMFEYEIESIRNQYQKDILFTSSVLYDHLV
ncbi:kinesin-domain-containing protein, partial [Yamadazyma tenuis ATCC 10573]